jgi:hypothetical protein
MMTLALVRLIVTVACMATYPLALMECTNLRDGFAEVRFKPISGSEDCAGESSGAPRTPTITTFVRANALEDNVVLYKAVNVTRSSFDLVGQTAAMAYRSLMVSFNGKPLFRSLQQPSTVGNRFPSDEVAAPRKHGFHELGLDRRHRKSACPWSCNGAAEGRFASSVHGIRSGSRVAHRLRSLLGVRDYAQ